jgi:hypothetical protein
MSLSPEGRRLLRLLNFGLFAFALDVVFLLIPNDVIQNLLLLITSPITVAGGATLMLNIGRAIDVLRQDLKRRGGTGFIVDWPDYSWRAAGLGLTIMGAGVFVSGAAGLT